MSENTKIEWTDSTFNPWIGCTQVSPACDDCYAARSTPARSLGVEWGVGKPRLRTATSTWTHPEKWNARAASFMECLSCGHRGYIAKRPDDDGYSVCEVCRKNELKPARRRVFCASLADWLDNEVPIAWLVDLLDLIRRTPNLDWLLLTKRIGNFNKRLTEAWSTTPAENLELHKWIVGWIQGRVPQHVWLGATVVNQEEADRDIPKLMALPNVAVRFLSIEPMLGPISIQTWLKMAVTIRDRWWVIAGGESGPRARPSHPDWFRCLRDQCAAAGVPFLFKQWGEWAPHQPLAGGNLGADVRAGRVTVVHPSGRSEMEVFEASGRNTELGTRYVARVGKKAAGRVLDGRTHDEFSRIA